MLGCGGVVDVECGVDGRDDAVVLVHDNVAGVCVGRVSDEPLLGRLRQPQCLGDLVLGRQTEVLLTEIVVAGCVPMTPLSKDFYEKCEDNL